MKRYAAAYTVKEHGHNKTKVYWTRAEDKSIAQDNFSHFVSEQCKQEVIDIYPMHNMD